MSVTVIVNPVAGGCTPARAQVRAAQARAGLLAAGEPGTVLLTERRGHGREMAARAVADGARLVIAWGGDGTVHEVASALVETGTALGIVRSGSGNGLARTLGVSSRPTRAIVEACRATSRRIDVGLCAGEPFFNLAGVGLDAEVARVFDRLGTARRGLRTYAQIVADELLRYEPRSYVIDGRPTQPALLLTVANGSQFGNGARIAPTARLDDGLLDLVLFEEVSRVRTCCAIPWLFSGGIARIRGVSIRQLPRVTIAGGGPLAYHVDGEPRETAEPLELSVKRSALQVAVR